MLRGVGGPTPPVRPVRLHVQAPRVITSYQRNAALSYVHALLLTVACCTLHVACVMCIWHMLHAVLS